MIVKFKNDYLEKLFIGDTLKGKPKYSDVVVTKFKKVILILRNVESSIELSKFRGLNFEKLKGNKKRLYSVRVDYGYRLEFKLVNDVIQLTEIAIIKNCQTIINDNIMTTGKVVGSDGQELKTDVLLHPGEVLEMEILSRGFTKSKFAMEIKMYPSHMSDILKGKRNITEEIALKLENILGISAEFWMRLQVEYNISLLRAKMNHAA